MRRLLPLLPLLLLSACSSPPAANAPGTPLVRSGDEIMVAGQLFHVGAPVVMFNDPGALNAYRTDKRFEPYDEAQWEAWGADSPIPPARYNDRIDRFNNGTAPFDDEKKDIVRAGYPLELLQEVVDQFVLHYDVAGTSAGCFDILHDHRGLSVHFMLDVDGTIYQSVDLRERTWHAGSANSRSIGIEIANVGAYGSAEDAPFDQWYASDEDGTYVLIPESAGGLESLRNPGRYHSARPEPVAGTINGRELLQMDLTEAQYDSLIKLTATLVEVFPKIANRSPKTINGEPINRVLSEKEFAEFTGIIGHYHESEAKVDPGPAFDWDRLHRGVDELLN